MSTDGQNRWGGCPPVGRWHGLGQPPAPNQGLQPTTKARRFEHGAPAKRQGSATRRLNPGPLNKALRADVRRGAG
ncbi:MAG: hypothetical protein ACK4SA_09145 [Caldilinea sp.]